MPPATTSADGRRVLASGTGDYFGLRGEIRIDLDWGRRVRAPSGNAR